MDVRPDRWTDGQRIRDPGGMAGEADVLCYRKMQDVGRKAQVYNRLDRFVDLRFKIFRHAEPGDSFKRLK
jgi:hypothetical protein